MVASREAHPLVLFFKFKNMPKILILGGNSNKNKDWVDSLANLLYTKKIMGMEIVGYHYSHWNTGDVNINFNKELEHISKILNKEKDYFVVAKSAGAILCLNGIFDKLLKPKASIFMGVAINWAKENKIWKNEWAEDYSVPTVYLQNSDDPAIEFDNLKKMLLDYNSKNYEIKIWHEHGHKYEDFLGVSNAVYNFIERI